MFSLSFIAVLFLSAGPAVEVSAPTLKPVATVEGVVEYRLANGLQVLVVPDLSRGTFTLVSAYLSGVADDPVGMTGIGHLIEHVASMQTTNHRNLSAETAMRGDFCGAFTRLEYVA